MTLARWPWFTAALAGIAIAAAPGSGLDEALTWRPGGERWRLATCQLAHWDADHLRWDVLALLVLGCWCEMRWTAATRWLLAAALPLIPLGIAIVHPHLAYRGLSGIACALAAFGGLRAAADARADRDGPALLTATTLLAGLLAKTTWELCSGQTVFTAAVGWRPLPAAHLLGSAIGSAAALTAIAIGKPLIRTPRRTHA